MALTHTDVLNKQFQTTKFRDGYDQDEVDDFLDEVLVEFQRLTAENETLRAQLAAAATAAAAPAGSPEAEGLRNDLAQAQAQAQAMQAELAQARSELEQARQQAQQAGVDGMGSAEYLQLARRVHEEHVREGVAKRDQLVADGTTQAQSLLSEAQTRASSLVTDAQAQADALLGGAQTTATTLVSEAQSKADSLVSQAQQAYDEKVSQLAGEVSQLEQSKSALQQSVTELQEFERNYRSSLKSHLETHLGELAGIAAVAVPTTISPTPPASAADTATGATGPSFATGEAPVTTGPTSVEPPVDPAATVSLEEPEPATSGDQVVDYSATPASAWTAPETAAAPEAPVGDAEATVPPVTGIPDFGTQRIDDSSSGLPGFGQATTGEQPSAPGFGGN